jgi:hypothetical protein
MRALEKDRSRRYETAVGLAQDVERYLADQRWRHVPHPGRTGCGSSSGVTKLR